MTSPNNRIKFIARDNDKKRFQRDYQWLRIGVESERIAQELAEWSKSLKQIKSDIGYNLISKKYGNN